MMLYDVIWCYMMLYDVIWWLMKFREVLPGGFIQKACGKSCQAWAWSYLISQPFCGVIPSWVFLLMDSRLESQFIVAVSMDFPNNKCMFLLMGKCFSTHVFNFKIILVNSCEFYLAISDSWQPRWWPGSLSTKYPDRFVMCSHHGLKFSHVRESEVF